MHSSLEQSPSLPPKSFPQDFPPPPKCFLHLLDNEFSPESSSSSDFTIHSDSASRSASRVSVSDLFDSKGKIISVSKVSEGSHSPTGVCLTTTGFPSGKTLSAVKNATHFPFNQDCRAVTSVSVSERTNLYEKKKNDKSEDLQDKEKAQLLGKLNSSLSKLKKEMTDLRTMDVSLLFKLISLHEAIQDFKLSVGDRFSEVGSEYSLGSASYMGSMSSLSEEDSDWMEGFQSHSSGKGLDDSQVFVDNQCASSLLDQITALVKKTDADF